MTRSIYNFNISMVFIFLSIVANNAHANEIYVPNYWNSNESTSGNFSLKNTGIKFVVTTNFPPFSFIDSGNNIRGFHSDLARAICTQLKANHNCLIQALPWDKIENSLTPDTALMSGLAISAETRKRLLFTRPYLSVPARFVTLGDRQISEPLFNNLRKKNVGVVDNTAHKAYLVQNFSGLQIRLFSDFSSMNTALAAGEIDAMFTDALTASTWMNSPESNDCCRYAGGAYVSRKFFGSGFSIAVGKDNRKLLNSLNFALKTLSENGKFSEIYLRYFPLGLF